MATLGGVELVPVWDHLGVVELQARWRESGDATLARLTGFGLARLEERVARHNRCGPSSRAHPRWREPLEHRRHCLSDQWRDNGNSE